jgi:hypothetical protein
MGYFKELINTISAPEILTTIVIILFFVAIRLRKVIVTKLAPYLVVAFVIFFLISLTDPHFRDIIAKPDNVPITILLVCTLFFTWLAMKQAIENDEHLAREEDIPPKRESEKVLVWPNLVYVEFICMIILTVALVLWSILVKAPLEQPASPAKAPNPSKAPWYFLGLQEMLVYYDPWIAGVVVPSIVIVGLMAIPYIDINPKGSGYYSFKERKFAVTMFLFGFTILWVYLIIIGTFLRGPNWNFFGPYEEWDIHKLVSLVNVNLSEIIYIKWFGVGLPKHWLIREIFGFLLTGLYFTVIPVVLAKTWFKGFYEKMGTTRFGILMFLFLSMLSLPIKMYLRWAFNLKYIIAIPEYFFNI